MEKTRRNEYSDQLRVIDWLERQYPDGMDSMPHGAYQWYMARLMDFDYSK